MIKYVLGRKKKAIAFLLIMLLLILPDLARADLAVHFLDVGQGDSAIILCDGEAMIIDGGPPGASQFIYSYIKNTLQLQMIDVMVSTHPHEDHVGGLAAVLNAVPVDLIISPTLTWNSKAFNSMLKYAEAQGTPIVKTIDGDSWYIGSALVTVVVCWQEAPLTNDTSIVLRIDYGESSFLFTGDAELMAEYIALESATPLKADVLKVSHHGSRSCSSLEFLAAVDPRYAVISCSQNNSYGHPHQEILDRLKFLGAELYRTDLNGTIICTSDGSNITWQVERTTDKDPFIAPAGKPTMEGLQ